MLAFFKNGSLPCLKTKMLVIYLLGVVDILLTLLLKNTGMFAEANPVMALFVSNAFGAVALKAILPAAIFVVLFMRMKAATADQLKKSNCLLCVILVFYALINVLHLIWFGTYLALV